MKIKNDEQAQKIQELEARLAQAESGQAAQAQGEDVQTEHVNW